MRFFDIRIEIYGVFWILKMRKEIKGLMSVAFFQNFDSAKLTLQIGRPEIKARIEGIFSKTLSPFDEKTRSFFN